MVEGKPESVQALTAKRRGGFPNKLRRGRPLPPRPAVEFVAEERPTRVGEVGADLVRAARKKFHVEPGGLRDRLDEAILRVMAGQTRPEDKALAVEAVDLLWARGVDGVILGCTEIPLLLGDDADIADLVNPAQLLAEAAVRFAMD